MSGPVKVDVLVVGSGAAGLSAAVTAAMHGASVMVAEKASVLGGTSAWSGGWLWIPRNPLARAEGIDEAADAPLTYLQHEMGGEAADIRLQTFLRYGPEMVEFFHQRTAVQFLSGSAMPDFHPSPGAANGGRSVTAQPYDGRLLGDWLHRLRPPLETISLGGMGIAGGADMAHFFNATRSPRSALYAARRLLRHGWQRLRAGRGQHLVNGNALVARLLRSALDAGVRFQLNAPVVRLLQGPPGVSGAVLRSDGGEIHVEAGAVVLACGGFPHDRQRLAQVVPHAAEGYGHFSAAPPDNQGEGIRLGESVGGQFDTSLRHPLAWAPVSRVTLASGQQLMFPHLVERAKPGVIAVLPNGKRFVNEADSYHDFIAALLAATPAGDTPQAWLLPESVRFLVIKQAPAARIRAILNRLYPGQISDNVRFILPAQPAAGNAMRIVLSRQYGFGSLMLWLVYFMGLFLVYILGSWLPTLVKAVGMTVSQAAIMTAIYQAGGTLGSLFAGWLMDRINPHRALGIIYAVGGLFTMAMGYAAGSFALLCMLAFISGACLNGANTGMNALSARYYPTQARATGSSWMHGVGRIGAILSAFAGAEMMALNLPFESVFLILGIPAALTVAGLAAKGIFAAGHPPVASTSPASVRGAS
ncbi:TPA: MFS transporter [Klebsiella pneumoniae]|nr:MFS transporter [Klebsiella pneumoniae]